MIIVALSRHLNLVVRESLELLGAEKSCSSTGGKICSTGRRRQPLEAQIHRDRSHVEVQLLFFANCRQLLDPPLPDGFYGNYFFPVKVTATIGSLAAGEVAVGNE
ncbi:unnamed protein product [Linum trigynum]|uniref:Uncharacterized protein n=1 Tax=Linum trigynum TaxID=586398 RepID=A0AAV2CB48_9ROSI